MAESHIRLLTDEELAPFIQNLRGMGLDISLEEARLYSRQALGMLEKEPEWGEIMQVLFEYSLCKSAPEDIVN